MNAPSQTIPSASHSLNISISNWVYVAKTSRIQSGCLSIALHIPSCPSESFTDSMISTPAKAMNCPRSFARLYRGQNSSHRIRSRLAVSSGLTCAHFWGESMPKRTCSGVPILCFHQRSSASFPSRSSTHSSFWSSTTGSTMRSRWSGHATCIRSKSKYSHSVRLWCAPIFAS